MVTRSHNSETEDKVPTKLRAFVIMPFKEPLQDIYEEILRPIFEDFGYSISRADDLNEHQNIIGNIVKGIVEADLLVADLSRIDETNGNVYYELGLAHALDKPVILLTQDIRTIPFDLRPYRMIIYSTHFSDVDRMRSDLTAILDDVRVGISRFASPISDHLPDRPVASIAVPGDTSHGQPGLLDNLEIAVHSMEDIVDDVTGMNSAIQSVQNNMKLAMTQMNASTTVRRRREAITEFASNLENDLEEFNVFADRYRVNMRNSSNALDASIEDLDFAIGDNREAGMSLLPVLSEFNDNLDVALRGVTSLRDAWARMPNIESNLTQIGRRMIRSLESTMDTIQQHKANVTRTRLLIQTRAESE